MSFAVKSRGRSPRQTWAHAHRQHGRAPMPPPFPQGKGGSQAIESMLIEKGELDGKL